MQKTWEVRYIYYDARIKIFLSL